MLCKYECGKKGVYQFKNGNWCCTDHKEACPGFIKKRSDARKKNGKKWSEESKNQLSKTKTGVPVHTKESKKVLSTKSKKAWADKDYKLTEKQLEHIKTLHTCREQAWNKGLSSNTDSRVAAYANSQQGQVRTGNWNPSRKGQKKQEPLEILSRTDPVYANFRKYRNRVSVRTKKTYENYKEELNPLNLPIGKCGIDGAYQIDHIISVRVGFEKGMLIEEISSKENLQIIPWLDNVKKYDGKNLRKSH